MKTSARLLFGLTTILSMLASAQISNENSVQKYLEQNSKLYSVFIQHSETKPLANEMLNQITHRLNQNQRTTSEDQIENGKALLFCAEVGAGMILVQGQIYGCEVFDIQNQKMGTGHFLWAYSYDFQLRSERSQVLDTFKTLIDKGVSVFKLDELFSLSSHVSLNVGYTWGLDYSDYKDLTLKKGFSGTAFEVSQGWGAGLKILSPEKSKENIKLVLGSVIYGDGDTGLSKVTIKFRKTIQLKNLNP